MYRIEPAKLEVVKPEGPDSLLMIRERPKSQRHASPLSEMSTLVYVASKCQMETGTVPLGTYRFKITVNNRRFEMVQVFQSCHDVSELSY